MVGHLQSKFPAMFQLYTSLTNCESLPTPFEVKIASASKDISEDDINKHLKSLELSMVSSIQAAFDKQTLVSLYQFGILLTNTFIVGVMIFTSSPALFLSYMFTHLFHCFMLIVSC